MHRNLYTQEIGVDSDTKVVPLRYALVLLAVIALGVWYGAGVLQTRFDERQAAKKLSIAADTAPRNTVAKK